MKNIIKSAGNKLKYSLLRHFVHNRTDMTGDQAKKILESNYAKKITSCIKSNTIHQSKYDLQIIIPVYNVEKYLAECLESIIRQQTSYSYCVLLIDDGSTDSSGTICDCYSGNNECIKVIHQSNKGAAAARNAGLKDLEANYIMFVDSDDFLETDSIQKLLDKAYSENADIVCGAHVRIIDGERIIYRDYDYVCKIEDKLGIPGFPWGKVYKKELFKSIIFPEGFWFEDTIIRFLVLNLSAEVYYIPDIIVNYRILSNSASHSSSAKLKSIDSYWITEILVNDYLKLGMPADERLLDIVLKQSKINYIRIGSLDMKIQEAVFVLTCQLINQSFDAEVLASSTSTLLHCFMNSDFSAYKLWCSTH